MKSNLIYIDFKKGVRTQYYQYEKDHQEQLILDNVIPMFPEHVNKTA